jgi:putative membrane protein
MKGAQRCRTCEAAAVGVQRLCFGAAIWRRVFPGPPPPEPDTPPIAPALLVMINGFLVLVALSALVSIWFGRTGGD